MELPAPGGAHDQDAAIAHAAALSTSHRFETELLLGGEPLVGLIAVNHDVLAHAEMLDRRDRIVLDMDSRETPVHGQQEGSAYNGHSADEWDGLLVPEIEREQVEGRHVAFQADAVFGRPEICEALEKRGVVFGGAFLACGRAEALSRLAWRHHARGDVGR